MKGMYSHLTSQVAQLIKNPPASAGDRRHGFSPWVGKIPWSRKWQPTPVYLPGSCMDRAWRATVHRVAESDTAVCVRVCTPTHPHTHTETEKNSPNPHLSTYK